MRLLTTMQFSRYWRGNSPRHLLYVPSARKIVKRSRVPLRTRAGRNSPRTTESRGVIWTLAALGAGLAATVAAYAFRLFTAGGVAAALAVGAAVLLAGGWELSLLLVGSFASTAILTRYRRAEKVQPEHRRGRSAIQVLANGVVPAALAVAGKLLGLPWAIPGAAGAIAVTTADTWATELGLLSRQRPRLITTGAPVERGRSGGITFLGTAAGVAGALVVGGGAVALLGVPAIAVAAAGVVGLLLDSVLGATAQAVYTCPACGRIGETPECTCGATRPQTAGVARVTNDSVNVLGTLAGALAAAGLAGVAAAASR